MRQLEKIKKIIMDIYRCGAMVMVAGILIIMSVQFFYRYVMNNSLSWSEELARFMFVWASSMGAVVVTGVRGHAAIKMLDSLFPHKVNLGKQFLFDLVGAAIGVILLYFGLQLMNNTWNQTSAALKLSYAYVYMAIPVGGFGISVQSLVNAIESLAECKAPSPAKNVDAGKEDEAE